MSVVGLTGVGLLGRGLTQACAGSVGQDLGSGFGLLPKFSGKFLARRHISDKFFKKISR